MIRKITYVKKCMLAFSFLLFAGYTFSQDAATPTGLVITDGTSGEFTLTWDADAGATQYNIFIRNSDDSADIYITTISAGSTSYTYSGTYGSGGTAVTITDGGTYTPKIQSLPDSAGDNYASATKTINPTVDPNAPTGLVFSSNGSGKFKLNWDADSNATGGYNIFIVEGGSGDIYITTIAAGSTSFNYQGTYGSVTVADGGTYTAKIQALPDGDFNAYSEVTSTLNPVRTIADGDWNTASTWLNDVLPGASDKPLINHNVTATSAISVDRIIVEEGKSISTTAGITVATDMTLLSSASFKTTSTFTGNVEYRRNLLSNADNTKGWYLIAAPVNGQNFSESWADDNSLATSGVKRGFAPYNNAVSSNNWSYFTNANTDALENGIGYSIKRSSDGEVVYKGTLNETSLTPTVTIGAGTAFNLLGNSFAGYFNSGEFLRDNSTNLELNIWIWNSTSENYEVKPSGLDYKVAPGQGFFVEAKNNNVPVTLDVADVSVNETNTFSKEISKSEIDLFITDGTLKRFAKIMYSNETSKGFDAGFDGKTFTGVSNTFDVFSRLLEDNTTTNYQIQSLPNKDLESMIIPIGVKSSDDKTITFSAKALNLPSNLKVILEDRQENILLELDDSNKTYTANISKNTDGIGRFYLHTKSSALSVDNNSLQSVKIYISNNSILNIVGLSQEKANLKMFNILGKQLLNKTFSASETKSVSLPNLAFGVYIVQLETERGKLNKKITLQ